MKLYPAVILLFALFACNRPQLLKNNGSLPARMYSREVNDSFSIFIQLPEHYNKTNADKYPVVYLLDANLYFDIMAAVTRRYAEVGLLPDVILVGIGYRDFPTMDSLRNRDYTYPLAIPEYEMPVSGGADKFLAFINRELAPEIDRHYKTDSSKRVLMGHSLGGYFTAYALYRDITGTGPKFHGYVAASPSLHYNNYYLPKQIADYHIAADTIFASKAYFTFGGLEKSTDSGDVPGETLLRQLDSSNCMHYISFKGEMLSNLDHMDTGLPTFIKGMQLTLQMPR